MHIQVKCGKQRQSRTTKSKEREEKNENGGLMNKQRDKKEFWVHLSNKYSTYLHHFSSSAEHDEQERKFQFHFMQVETWKTLDLLLATN